MLAESVPPDQRDARRIDRFLPRFRLAAACCAGGAIEMRRGPTDTQTDPGVSSAHPHDDDDDDSVDEDDDEGVWHDEALCNNVTV